MLEVEYAKRGDLSIGYQILGDGPVDVSYRDLANPAAHEYITHSREKMLGQTLEEMQKGSEDRLPQISAALEAALGTLYLAILIGRIVGQLAPGLRRSDAMPDNRTQASVKSDTRLTSTGPS